MRETLAPPPSEPPPTPFDIAAAGGDPATFVEDFLRLAEWLRDRTEGACDRS
jgi:hypothetical protein